MVLPPLLRPLLRLSAFESSWRLKGFSVLFFIILCSVVSNEKAATGKFVLHTVQLSPGKSVMNNNHEKMFSLSDLGEWSYGLPVQGKYEFYELARLKRLSVFKAAHRLTAFD